MFLGAFLSLNKNPAKLLEEKGHEHLTSHLQVKSSCQSLQQPCKATTPYSLNQAHRQPWNHAFSLLPHAPSCSNTADFKLGTRILKKPRYPLPFYLQAFERSYLFKSFLIAETFEWLESHVSKNPGICLAFQNKAQQFYAKHKPCQLRDKSDDKIVWTLILIPEGCSIVL